MVNLTRNFKEISVQKKVRRDSTLRNEDTFCNTIFALIYTSFQNDQ